MSDLASEAHMMYVKLLAFQVSRIGQQDEESDRHVHQQRQNITALILQFLCVCQPKDRFKYVEFTKIICDSGDQETFEPEKAVQAFLCLENYITLLYLMPWKKEYNRIKKYGGHYQTRIASHIKGAEVILRLVGFTDLATGLMILNHHTKSDVLQYIAFECLVASAECLIISQICRKIDRSKLSVKEIVQVRLENSGNAEGIISMIDAKYGGVSSISKEKDSDVLVARSRSGRSSSKRADSALFRDKLQEHLKKAEAIGKTDTHNDIPYMDDEVKEIDRKPENFEDHLQASLQLVSVKDTPPAPCGVETSKSQTLRASQEWSFVNEGLEKKYGKQYFDGPREDILQQPEQSRPKDPTYVDIFTEPRYANAKSVGPPPPDKGPRLVQNVTPFTSSVYPGYPAVVTTKADSAYYSTPSPLIYSPDMDRSTLIQRGLQQQSISEIQRRETNHPSSDMSKNQTAPLLRKISDTSKASRTYPGNDRRSDIPAQYENIKKYHKPTPASMPIEKDILRSQTNQIPFSSNPIRPPYSMEMTGNVNVRDSSRTNTPKSINYPISDSGISTSNSSMLNKAPVINYTNNSNNTRQWQCIYCTLLNDYADSVCRACSKSRDRTETDGPLVGDVSRVCDKCTLENSPNSRICTACGNELRGVQTVI